MQKTLSITIGKGSIGHNNRAFFADNIDSTRSKNNIIFHKKISEKYIVNGLVLLWRSTMQNRSARTELSKITTTIFFTAKAKSAYQSFQFRTPYG